jgi:hypothetical protein
MKRGKEISIDLRPNYKVKLGTVDNKNPKSIYINLSAWGELRELDEDVNYESVIKRIRKNIKQNLNSNIREEDFHKDRYIVDLDMRSSGISDKKRSFMSCEITLFQKNGIPVNNPKMVSNAKTIANNIINDCLDKQDHFDFHRTKK